MGLKRSDAFPSRYLGKDDLTEPVRDTIADVRMETIKGDSADEDKAVLVLDNLKPLILNNTNWETLEGAYGEDTDGWAGKPVEMYIDPGVMYGKKRVGGVRVRVPAGTNVQPPAEQAPSTLLTMDQAVALAEGLNHTKDELVAVLKEKGLTGYKASEATPIVRELLAKWEKEDIPF